MLFAQFINLELSHITEKQILRPSIMSSKYSFDTMSDNLSFSDIDVKSEDLSSEDLSSEYLSSEYLSSSDTEARKRFHV